MRPQNPRSHPTNPPPAPTPAHHNPLQRSKPTAVHTPAPVAWFYPAPPLSARAVRRTVAEFRTVLPRWLAARSPSSRPLVYVSLGTLTTAMTDLRTVVGSAYREIMAALSAIDCDAIVSAGNLAKHRPPHQGRRTRPATALLRHADLFVTHGGRASLLDAVQGATPVLVMGILADQPDNATAFARRDLGRALDLTATRVEIAEAITAVLGTPQYAAAMRTADAELSQLPPLDLIEQWTLHGRRCATGWHQG
ncbi:glycosyltransferase [Streptomyces sp. NPDC015032]|uniref:glycosyltransferase n=1 Tax=Streptomyces sp. NPDC015032 TaxID=3364937 RepID=UPI0036F5BFAD